MRQRGITQAVIVIHGIGEQKPMDTLRGFVDAVLPKPKKGEKYFSKPDRMSESFELRKLQDRDQPRTRFFEYYWAYKVEGTDISHVLNWIKTLLLRKPGTVPAHLLPLWWISIVLIAVVMGSLALGLFNLFTDATSGLPFSVSGIGSVLFAVLQGFVINSVGDAARYLSPHPRNIALRRAIRSDGIKLLRNIHESGEYDRVVLVGHSLGSVIAYDIIKYLWQEYNEDYELPTRHSQLALDRTEKAGEEDLRKDYKALESDSENPDKVAKYQDSLHKYQDSQIRLWRELRELGNPWLVTDLVTLGSPLAHAAILLAKDRMELEERQHQRELPKCPPEPEEEKAKGKIKRVYSYKLWDPFTENNTKFKLRALHHAAPFACTRWTNLYFPVHLGLFGDLVGGPLKEYIGPGVHDIPVTLSKFCGLAKYTLIAHSSYWWADKKKHGMPEKTKEEKKKKVTPSLTALVKAIDRDGERTFTDVAGYLKLKGNMEEPYQSLVIDLVKGLTEKMPTVAIKGIDNIREKELKEAEIGSVRDFLEAVPTAISEAIKEPIANAIKYIDHAKELTIEKKRVIYRELKRSKISEKKDLNMLDTKTLAKNLKLSERTVRKVISDVLRVKKVKRD